MTDTDQPVTRPAGADQQAPLLPRVDPHAAQVPAPQEMTPDLLAGFLADGDEELAAWVLNNALSSLRRAEVYDGLLRDAMVIVGRHWQEGRWSVADEHLASQTLVRSLERVRPELGPESRVGPVAVLAGVSGEHHALGLMCLAHVLADDGWTVVNLGPDVPAADLARYLHKSGADLVGLTARLPEREMAIRESVAAAHSVRPESPLPVLLGGPITRDTDLVASLAVEWAGESLVAARDFARPILERLHAEQAAE